MQIELKGHAKRVQKAKDFWLRVLTDFNGGIDPSNIAKRYTNPKTKRPYTREHIYWILRQLKTRPA